MICSCYITDPKLPFIQASLRIIFNLTMKFCFLRSASLYLCPVDHLVPEASKWFLAYFINRYFIHCFSALWWHFLKISLLSTPLWPPSISSFVNAAALFPGNFVNTNSIPGSLSLFQESRFILVFSSSYLFSANHKPTICVLLSCALIYPVHYWFSSWLCTTKDGVLGSFHSSSPENGKQFNFLSSDS